MTVREEREVSISSIQRQLWEWYKATGNFEVLRSAPAKGKLRVNLEEWDIVSEQVTGKSEISPSQDMMWIRLRRKPVVEVPDAEC